MEMTDLAKSVHMKTAATRLQVFAPFNQEFIDVAHRLGARFRKRTSMWSFKRHQYPDVAKACNRVFGTDFQVVNGRDEL